MNFSIVERIKTNKSKEELQHEAVLAFMRVAGNVVETTDEITVTSINATFGSINRTDKTVVLVKPKDDGFLLAAHVNYTPSVAFWVFIVLSIFSYVGWVVPIGFYLWHKHLVRTEIERVFSNLRTEFAA